MKTIKRYQNRKLYDTEASTYVTLDDITQMIRSGEDVKVVDNKTKRDLTAVTLAQIIFEEQKKQREILPLPTLKQIIKTSGESITDFVEKRISPGLGAFQSAHKEIEQYVDRMVNLGKLSAEEGRGLVGEFRAQAQRGIDDLQKMVDDRVKQVLERVRGYSSLQGEVDRLEEKVAELESLLEEEKTRQAAAKKRSASRKKASS